MDAGILVPIALFLMIAVIAIGVPIAKAWARRMDKQTVLPSPVNGEVLTRLERIEQALEVMSTEVERITEGQRFVTRLLSETRQPVAVPAAVPAAPPVLPPTLPPAAPQASQQAAPHIPPARPDDGTILHDAARSPDR